MSFLILVGGFTSLLTSMLFMPPTSSSPGMLAILSQSNASSNPTWLDKSPLNSSIIYATSENDNGAIVTYLLDKITGEVAQVDSVDSRGSAPTHFAIDPSKPGSDELVAINFGGGSAISVGSQQDLVHFKAASEKQLAFTGKGPSAEQASAHPHQVVFHDNEILVPDLGSDQVWRVTKSGDGSLSLSGNISQPAGSGPRRVVVQDNRLFTLHEISSTLTEHDLSAQDPQLVTSLSVVAPDTPSSSKPAAAELLVTPSSKAFPNPLLFASNRNEGAPAGDSIAIFSIDPQLKLLGHVRTGLSAIRGMAFIDGDTEARYLIAAGQDAGGLVVFERGGPQGELLTVVAKLNDQSVVQPASFVTVKL